MQPGLISSQYFLLLLSNSNIALLLTHSWEMQHNGWIVMQLGRLEFLHIAVLHRIALPALVVHGGSLSIVELQRIMLHCGTLSPAHSSALSTGQVGFFDVAADCIALRLNTHISPLNTCCVGNRPNGAGRGGWQGGQRGVGHHQALQPFHPDVLGWVVSVGQRQV